MESEPKIPDNREQKGTFDTQANTLPPHVLEGIEESMNQFKNGEFISLEEFKKRHFFRYR